LRDGVADRLQRPVQHGHRLRQVDDVDVVAGAEDVLRHLRVPAVGLMAEMNASFQELAHAEVGQRHGYSPVDPPRTDEPAPADAPMTGGQRKDGAAPDGFWAKVRV
jgi:hypothetical protein